MRWKVILVILKGGEKMQLECKIIAPESSGVQFTLLGIFVQAENMGLMFLT